MALQSINECCDKANFDISYYFQRRSDGQVFERDADNVVAAGSVRKIFILMCVMKEVQQGKLHFDQKFKIAEEDIDTVMTLGVVQYLDIDMLQLTLKDLLYLMMMFSDNTATKLVGNSIGLDTLNSYCQTLGCKNTVHRYISCTNLQLINQSLQEQTVTTARDVGTILNWILEGANGNDQGCDKLGCSQELCQLAITIMSKEALQNRLPLFLPSNCCANKPGISAKSYNDAGIVYDRKVDKAAIPLFIMAIFTKNVPDEGTINMKVNNSIEFSVPCSGKISASFTIASIVKMFHDMSK